MTGKTGEKCQKSGVYRCTQHPENEIPLSEGERFPPCGIGDGHGAIWELVREA